MDVLLHSGDTTADIGGALLQVTKAFAHRLRLLAAEQPPFEQIGTLAIAVSGAHPLAFAFSESRRGFYDKRTNQYYVGASAKYEALSSPNWGDRVGGCAEAALSALQKVARTRMTDAERDALVGLISEARDQTAAGAPTSLIPAGRVFVKDPASTLTGLPLLSFDQAGPQAGMIEVLPEEIQRYVEQASTASNPSERLFKSYARFDGVLRYREAWINDDFGVTEHWGEVGQRGEHRVHEAADEATARLIFANLRDEARAAGFRPISPSREATLVVEYRSADPRNDIARRHAIEDYLDEQTGWLGLGHVDGGSIGSGTMEVFCVVADYSIARGAIADALQASSFSDYARIYRMKG